MDASVKIKKLIVGQMAENCYLITDVKSGQTIIIDPGDDPDYISDIISREGLNPIAIVATHGHFDHILGVSALQLIYNLPFFINQKDEFLVNGMSESAKHYLGLKFTDPHPEITGYLRDNEKVEIGKESFKVIESPGHTPGSVCFCAKANNILFVGDLLFAGGAVGRTDFKYSNADELTNSIKKILALPNETIVYPGHGEVTDIKNLKKLIRPHSLIT